MTTDELAKRQAIIDACRRMNALGINQGTSGNISVRHVDGLLVTPTFGTAESSEHAVRALEGRLACLLDHHGMIAVGKTLDKAMWLAVEVETLARQYHGCLQIGQPPLLHSAEIERVRQRMAGYGLPEG
ncbi:hypothetical protein D6B98_03990 [Bradyrhizobium sp. LVM 105]|uniref:Class II aldolase/adducin N-terminal domain-containing protein n=2 Tax=Nitrobacteraceae TaxID=41294 RepID=A0A4Y9L412_9BRAD|nr:hypothetical protein D6B98_03990 [Bradyrhizobium sp. LVM 105]TFV38321.1 hypothetical protein E4K66_16655 [Bradyrhizobium frederickii]